MGFFTVIIATCGRPEHLDAVIRCLSESTCRIQLLDRVIIVDNHPASQARPIAQNWSARGMPVRYMTSPPYDKASALNVGIRLAETEWLVFTDDDTLPKVDWLEKGWSYVQESGVRVFGGRVAAEPLDDQRLPIWMRPGASGFIPLTGIVVDYLPRNESGMLASGMTAPFGANLFARKDVFYEYGFYDEALWALCVKYGKWPVGVEDSEMGYRLMQSGEPLGFCHTAVVEHPVNYDRCSLRLSIRQAFSDGWRQPLIFIRDYQRRFEWFRVRLVMLHLLRCFGRCVCLDWAGGAHHVIECVRCVGTISGRLSRAFLERRLQGKK